MNPVLRELQRQLNDIAKQLAALQRAEMPDVVRTSGDQAVAGVKTFSDDIAASVVRAAGAGGLALEDDGGNVGVFVEDGGEVGIGTATPGTDLHIKSTKDFNNTAGLMRIEDTNGRQLALSSLDIFRRDSDSDTGNLRLNHYGYNGGATRFRDTAIGDGKANTILFVDGSAGFVGVKTTSPAADLHVNMGTDKNIWLDDGASGSTQRIVSVNDAGNTVGPLTIQGSQVDIIGEMIAANGIRSGSVTIADDSFTLLAAANIPERGMLFLTTGVNADEAAIIAYRLDATSVCTLMVGMGATAVSTATLNGTTGADNFCTVSATTSGLYIENRHGTSRTFRYLLMGD